MEDIATLDAGLRAYLERLAEAGGYTSLAEVAQRLNQPEASGESEISNRVVQQRALRTILESKDFAIEDLKKQLNRMWALSGRFDSVWRSRFFESEFAIQDIRALLDEQGAKSLDERINTFLDLAIDHGFRPKDGNPSRSAVGLFASVLLSSVRPQEVVDFRKDRWNTLYQAVTGNDKPLIGGGNYGQMILKAGHFASQLAKTSTYRELFGDQSELWGISGFAWGLRDGVPYRKRYWAGGFLFGGTDSRLQEFIEGGYWRHGYNRESDDPTAKKVWALFDQIKPGDELAIKGYGGQADLQVKMVGRVTDADAETGRVALEKRDVPLYHGKGPRGSGAGNWQSTLLEVTRPDVIELIFGKQEGGPMQEEAESKLKDALPGKNIILYGPPGTGKTFTLQSEYTARFTERGKPKTRDQFADELAADLVWWEICALVLLDLKTATVSEMLAHPITQSRQRRSATRNARAILWSQLQMHAKRDCENVAYATRLEPMVFTKSADSLWSVDADLLNVEAPEIVATLAKWKGVQPSTERVLRRYEFVTFHQSYSYEDFVEGIKPTLGGEAAGDLSYEIKPGIFLELAERAAADQENDYAIFIDEINRGNVASIFGELITLLEEDKRVGKANEITVRLPYSRRKFGVPPNLYVIGTMNTADRSVEALDAALRRRFKFIPCMPDITKLPEGALPGLGVDLRRLLGVINQRLEKLLDRDHCLGHAEFMRVAASETSLDTLRTVMANWVLPLLEEYFYRDPGKIALVLGDSFIRKRDEATRFAAGLAFDDEARDVFDVADISKLDAEAFRSIYE
jgi:hypothetical protein